MAGSLNKVTLIGNVGADPEVRNLNSGTAVANLSLATSETWKDKDGEKQERTEWHRVVVWNDGLISVIEKYVKKGSKLYIEGQLQTRKWEDQDGKDRYSTEVVLTGFDCKLLLLGDPGGGGSRDQNGNADRPGNRRSEGGGSNSGGRNSYAERNGKEERGQRDDNRDRGRQDQRGNFTRDVDDEIPF